MRALILAAGKGTRISRYLSGKPKCTVDIGKIKLIRYTVELLKKLNIKNIGIVLGYGADEIKNELIDENIEYFYNPFYEITNSLASSWFAKDFIEKEDLLIMNADVFLEERLLKSIIDEEKSPILFADETRKEEADYKLYYKNGILIDYGKELQKERITGEYIGVAKIKAENIEYFKQKMDMMLREKKYDLWWENILYESKEKVDIFVKKIDDLFWAEVDYIEDYERILKYRGYALDYTLNIKKIK